MTLTRGTTTTTTTVVLQGPGRYTRRVIRLDIKMRAPLLSEHGCGGGRSGELHGVVRVEALRLLHGRSENYLRCGQGRVLAGTPFLVTNPPLRKRRQSAGDPGTTISRPDLRLLRSRILAGTPFSVKHPRAAERLPPTRVPNPGRPVWKRQATACSLVRRTTRQPPLRVQMRPSRI